MTKNRETCRDFFSPSEWLDRVERWSRQTYNEQCECYAHARGIYDTSVRRRHLAELRALDRDAGLVDEER